MNDFNFDNFLKIIEEDLNEARKLSSDLADYQIHEYDSERFIDHEKKRLDEYSLSDTITRAIIKVKFALEYLRLPILLQDFTKIVNQYESYHDEFEYIPYVGVVVNPVVGHIQDFVDAITCHINLKAKNISKIDEKQILLEQILIGTPKIIMDNGFEPKNESEIRNAVYKILIHVFPDTVREIPISKISKVYKPDIGIRSLKTAIEYKFANSLEELKKSIGGIFEDIQGYEGSDDWNTFYAVIYQTDHFMTQNQVEAEFYLSKVSHNWKPILVFGKGERLQKMAKEKLNQKK